MKHLSSIVPARAPQNILDFAKAFDVKRIGTEDAAWIELSSHLSTVDYNLNRVCNAGINKAEWYVGCETWNGEAAPRGSYYGGSCSAELRERFNDWFLHRSWCSELLTAVKDRVIVISGELPSNVVVAILSMQRTPREHGTYVKRMFSYVDELGCPEDLAFAITFLTRTSDGGSINDNHNILGTSNHQLYIKNFLDRNFVRLNPPIKDNASYRGITAMWGGDGRCNPDIAGFVRAFPTEKVKAKAVVVPNPFIPVVNTGSEKKITEAQLSEIIPIIMEYYDNARLVQAA